MIRTASRGGYCWSYSNAAAPSATPGTSIVPGAAGAEGTATQIASSANITDDVFGVSITAIGGNLSNTSKMHLLDMLYDPAGGTAWSLLWENVEIGSSAAYASGLEGRSFYIPCFIPAGSAVAVRIQGNNATAGTVFIWAIFHGRPQKPESMDTCYRFETIGTIAGSSGVAVTPGLSAAEGLWTLIGATTFPWRYILPSFQIDDASTTAQTIHMDVAMGDATNKIILCEHLSIQVTGGAEQMMSSFDRHQHQMWHTIPAGINIYVRLSTTIATADANYDVLVTGGG